jgi:hypothetical protein
MSNLFSPIVITAPEKKKVFSIPKKSAKHNKNVGISMISGLQK